MDFPRAWQISRATHESFHHIDCSYRKTHGGLLCDCHILTKHPEYETKENKGGNMGKCWMFEETGEVRVPRNEFIVTEWVATRSGPASVCELHNPKREYPILKLTEYPSNPLEPILEVWGKWKDKTEEVFNPAMLVCEFWEAIEKCMVIVEGK